MNTTCVKIGEKEYSVAPVNFAGVRRIIELQKKINAVGLETIEQLDFTGDIIMIVLKRTYPAMTREEIEESLDFDNFQQVLSDIMGACGLKKRIPTTVTETL